MFVTVFFGVEPEVGEGWFEKAGADAVEVRDVIPFGLAGGKDGVEVGPPGYVGLDKDDIVFAS